MGCGKILYAVHEGTYVLRLLGDVRATWCASFEELIDRMLADAALHSVVVDLHETTNIDSTMLGLLAKIAVQTRDRLPDPPLLLAPNDDIRRLLESMCLQKVFRVAEERVESACECAELPIIDRPESDLCRQVAAAHRILMDIDERNRAVFHDLVATIEGEQQRISGCR